MITNRSAFLSQAATALGAMLDNLAKQPDLELSRLPAHATVLAIIDMNLGFTREGALHSDRVNALAPEVLRLQQHFRDHDLPILAFTDAHPAESPEFTENGGSYPAHCLRGTDESRLLPEIEAIGGYTLIPKNSTNAALEPLFQAWQRENPERRVYVVAGDCSDICIEQFANTVKADANRRNQQARVIVVANAVDTYDAPRHSGDLMHLMGLSLMLQNGVEVAPRAI